MTTPVILVIDTETTGFDPQTDRVVEFAATRVRVDGHALLPDAIFTSLVKPGIPIPPKTSAIHHITDRDVENAPDLTAVLASFAAWLAERDWTPRVFVGQNVGFDRGFLKALEDMYPQAAWACTLQIARRLWPLSESHSNQNLRYELDLQAPVEMAVAAGGRDSPHSAGSDTIVTACLLNREVQILRERYGDKIRGLNDLITWANTPVRQEIVTTGYDKGKRYVDMTDKQLDWLLENAKGDIDIPYTIEQIRADRAAGRLPAREPQILETMPFGKHKGMAMADLVKKESGYADWLLRESSDPDVKNTIRHLRTAANGDPHPSKPSVNDGDAFTPLLANSETPSDGPDTDVFALWPEP